MLVKYLSTRHLLLYTSKLAVAGLAPHWTFKFKTSGMMGTHVSLLQNKNKSIVEKKREKFKTFF